MKFSYVIFILTILQNGLITKILCVSWDDILKIHRYKGGDGNCSRIVSFQESQRVPYLETFRERKWGIFYQIQMRENYRIQFRISYRKEYYCCSGYNRTDTVDIFNYSTTICEPICSPACKHGVCYRPNICICYEGYTHAEDIIFDSICVPVCDPACVHGKCNAPNSCTCDSGYSLSTNDHICEPVCDPPCDTGSYCSEPNRCACLQGYTIANISSVASREKIVNRGFPFCRPVCKNKCIHGVCTAPDTCTCTDGYELDPDNFFVCKPKCEHGCLYGTCTGPNVCTCNKGYSPKNSSVCEPICSEACERGTCVAPESCSCFKGFGLLGDSKYVCKPVCEKACLNGRCTAPGVCTCNEGFRLSGDESAKHICEPYCETACEPFGVCTAPNVCTCFEGFRLTNKTPAELSNFTVRYSVCEPICETECINGFCSAPNTCSCNSGYQPSGGNATDNCEPICTKSCINSFCNMPETCTCNKGYLPTNTSNLCIPHCKIKCINAHCSAPNTCTCNSGYDYQSFESKDKFICEPICNPSCKNGICIGPDSCKCHSGYRGAGGSIYSTVCEPICEPDCGTNGICKAHNSCVCKDGYRMINYKGNVPFRCEPICSVDCGNGTCTAPDLCACFDGYRNAKTGKCEPVCSRCNNGTCVAPEVCECDDGFIPEDHSNEIGQSENKPQNGSRCVPHCENCDNGECVAPDDCLCHAGFVKYESTCVHACQGGCGSHGECIDQLRTCECNYGWTGLHCEQPTLCVLILSNDANRTEPITVIEEKNTTIEHILVNNPTCSECNNKINNGTLCFKIYFNGTQDETQIGCLMDKECLAMRSQYRDPSKIIKLSGIAGGFLTLLLIGIATYLILLKCRKSHMDLDDMQVACRHSTSIQGLIQQDAINS